MLYMIYDAAVFGYETLTAIQKAVSKQHLLLDNHYDGDIASVAPWIFQVNEDELEILRNNKLTSQKYLWLESDSSISELTTAFQEVIYEGNIPQASKYLRCWNMEVLLSELKTKNKRVQLLFQHIQQLYLLSDENMEAYYLDNWGVLNQKNFKSFI